MNIIQESYAKSVQTIDLLELVQSLVEPAATYAYLWENHYLHSELGIEIRFTVDPIPKTRRWYNLWFKCNDFNSMTSYRISLTPTEVLKATGIDLAGSTIQYNKPTLIHVVKKKPNVRIYTGAITDNKIRVK